MLSPRIFWLCTHQTLRYEEVLMLIEAGAEVIPCLGDPFWLKYDGKYDNENDDLYPYWRKFCTLPTYITEKIRRIDFWTNKGKLSVEEADLVNRWIDVIFVSSNPDILENIISWFQGYIVFRVFGHGGYTTYTEVMNKMKVNINKIASADKYIWAPMLNNLENCEDPRIIKNKFYLNAFVSNKRLKFKWKGKNSKPFISTTISYLDGNPVVRHIFKEFSRKFENIPYIVLGKNSKEVVRSISDKVLGYLDDDHFYSKISESRIFVYFGVGSNYHLHYTPIEAITMGVPVMFLESSGLAQEARDFGVSNEELKRLGMCANPQEMKRQVEKNINDLYELQKLSENQHNIFSKIFSRETALSKTKNFLKKIQPYVKNLRINEYKEDIELDNISKNDCFRNNSMKMDLPTQPDERVNFSIENINAFTGKLLYDHKGKFIGRRVEEGTDSAGIFIGNYLGKMKAGEYLFSMELNSSNESKSSLGAFSIGIWKLQYKILNSRDVSNIKVGKNIIDLFVKISPENSDLLKEIRFVWNGINILDVLSITVEKLT
ncbi:glycosyltransferase [Maledivibacter halophilus]|uniref:Uncharacterized protein n=1 Tax=Maledivibacter halophilus TaxID=36842 RepID=A0A1T5L2H0_9FIRM|nr:glycosyltransferase [Maledivibacter halophilus]SKC69809.1 hypothetical protein SAMN02194393_02310 [Maledivibacter halophilus]